MKTFLSKNIFHVLKRNFSHPVCLSLHQFYFQIIMHFFYNVYYLQRLLLENKLRTFTVIDDAQK